MITDKIIERCQKIIDKENKPKTEAEKDTLRGKLYQSAAYIDGDTYLAHSFLSYKFYQSDYALKAKEMPEDIALKVKDLFKLNAETKVEIPAMEFYKYFDLPSKVADIVKVEFNKDGLIVTPVTLKGSTGAECLLNFTYRHDFGFEFRFDADPKIIKEALIPAFASKQESVLLKMGASLHSPIRFEGIGFESLFALKRTHDSKK